jgi:hypothetical protein
VMNGVAYARATSRNWIHTLTASSNDSVKPFSLTIRNLYAEAAALSDHRGDHEKGEAINRRDSDVRLQMLPNE